MRKRAPCLASLSTRSRRDFGDALQWRLSARAARGPATSRRLVPSRTISGRLRSISGVTSNSCAMIGAGPFSARARARLPAGDGEFLRYALGEAPASREPYFMRSIVIVEPKPRKPMP